MRTIRGGIFTILVLVASFRAPAQSGPPLPPVPLGYPLDWWRFDDTNWLTVSGYAPVSFTNLALVPDWDNNALQVDSTNAAWLQYNVVEANGRTNLATEYGSLSFWFLPNWSSTNQGGAGPGVWARLIDIGAYTTNASYGWWSLYLNPSGDDLFFSAQTNNGVTTNYLFAPVSWDSTTWHLIDLAYSLTNTSLYIDGVLATNGPGISILPGSDVLTNGFYIGSDSNGIAQVHGQFENLWTYDYPLDSNDIAANYAYFAPFANPTLTGSPHTDGDPPFPGGGGGGGDGGGSGGFTEPSYSSNDLWLAIYPPGTNAYATNTNSGTLTIVLNNTIADIAYELFSATNLTATNISWTLEQTVFGSEVTNYTATIISMNGRTNLFLKALAATLDSDGDGLPDWWETLYSTTNFPLSPTNADTGNTGIPDGYKQDSAGDGYDNLQKYQMGVPPNVWVTPPAPQGFNAVLNSNETSAILTWNASPGPVTNYTILVQDDQDGGFNVLANLPATQTNFTDSSSTFSDGIQYEIQADYAGGASAITGEDDPTVNPEYTVQTAIVRGPQGGLYLVASTIPQNVVAIRVYWGGGYTGYPEFTYGNYVSSSGYTPPINNSDNYSSIDPSSYFDVPISDFSNGVYQIPTSKASLFGYYFFAAQAVTADGQFGRLSGSTETNSIFNDLPNNFYTWFALNVPFVDARSNIEQNTAFLLRAARSNEPFLIYFDQSGGNYPGIFYAESGNTNYVASGYYFDASGYAQIDEFHPYEESSLYDYLIYSPGFVDATGLPANGVVPWYPGGDAYMYVSNSSLMFQPENYFASYDDIPSVLGSPTNFIMSFRDIDFDFFALDGCVTNGGSEFKLASTAKNYYGLPFTSVMFPESLTTFGTVNSGGTFTYGGTGCWFQNVAAPILGTAGYYFARPNIDPLPGEAGFSTTNTTASPIIIPFGQSFTISAWAKQAVTNGYGSVYAYPEQYFDKAYFADTNGYPTTNQTGILSEYGEFFPTDPGPIILTTKPDGATGATGQCTINVIKMALDVNHDGTMDLSYGGPDNTSADRPFKFWINNDWDKSDNAGDPGEDVDNLLNTNGDSSIVQVHSQRDLEDFARLWICGVPALSNSYQVTLSWNVINGNPAIQLVNALETNGGYAYLTNSSVGSNQATTYYDTTNALYYGPGFKFASVSPTQPFTFPAGYFSNGANQYFLFDGAGIGEGELVLAISQNGTNVASTSVFMNLMDVSTMFEHAEAVNVPDSKPPSSATSRFVLDNTLPADPTEAKQMIVFVHGINNTPWAYENTSETMFKRLYWSGYQGRFSAFRWPCGYFPPSSGIDLYEFNESEFWAYKSAPAFKGYLTYLRGSTNRLPGYGLDIIAHSQGAAVVTEAFSEGAPFDNCILTQGAVPAHCYATNAPPLASLVNADALSPTPYAASIGGYNSCWTNISGNVVNFFNTNDFALVSGSYVGLNANWIANQATQKPENFTGGPFYSFDTNTQTSTAFYTVDSSYTVTDFQESRSMVARSRTMAVGAQGGLGGIVSDSFDLKTELGFTNTRPEHSAQFTRPIQTVLPYYVQITNAIAP